MKNKKTVLGIIIIFIIIFTIIYLKNKTQKTGIKKSAKQIIKPISVSETCVASTVSVKKTNISKTNKINLVYNDKSIKLVWNYETFKFFQNQLGLSFSKRRENILVNAITNTAIANNLEVPSNIVGFTKCMFYLPLTNERADCERASFFSNITNEVVGDTLLTLFTNHYKEKYIQPGWYEPYDRSDLCLSALGNIRTPELMDKLNKALIELNKNNRRFKEPNATIDPDRFPKESEDWLFNSPYNKVKDKMAGNWLGSERPETVDVLRRYIKKLDKMDKMDPYFIDGWREDDKPHMKKLRLKRLNDQVDKYERRYQRWIEDDKRMPLRYGTYSNGSWEEYKKESEEERKLKYLDAYKAKVPIPPNELRRLKNQRLNRRYKPTKREGN